MWTMTSTNGIATATDTNSAMLLHVELATVGEWYRRVSVHIIIIYKFV